MERENKIVYLLGAGASADKCFPTDLGFSDELRKCSINLRSYSQHLKDDAKLFCGKICDDLHWLAEQSKPFISVDSYAKYCFDHIKFPEHSANFYKAKKTLSLYFTLEQVLFGKRDFRYKHFISKLTRTNSEGKHYFPTNISILNWNYDFQMELASNIYRKEIFNSNHEYILPIINYYPQLGNDEKIRGNLNMIHLNGIAGFQIDNLNKDFVSSHFLKHEGQTPQAIFNKLMLVNNGQDEFLHFAFEKTPNDYSRMLELIEQMIKEADYLVVIGYSFLSMENNVVDKKIFNILKKGKLKKIYVQDFDSKEEIIRDRFQIFPNIKIEHKPDCRTFFVPHYITETITETDFIDMMVSK